MSDHVPFPTTPGRTRSTQNASVTATPPQTGVNASAMTASPAYTTTRRHSLYGTEDRVVIDPGSRIWKVGFSGESRPRAVFHVQGHNELPLWSLNARASDDYEEEERNLYNRLRHELRKVFHESGSFCAPLILVLTFVPCSTLLADPKSRKVIILEHPLMPIYVKEMIGQILFENLLVPSISFAPSGLLSLLAVGRITGLVLDCGHLETTVIPVSLLNPSGLFKLISC